MWINLLYYKKKITKFTLWDKSQHFKWINYKIMKKVQILRKKKSELQVKKSMFYEVKTMKKNLKIWRE